MKTSNRTYALAAVAWPVLMMGALLSCSSEDATRVVDLEETAEPVEPDEPDGNGSGSSQGGSGSGVDVGVGGSGTVTMTEGGSGGLDVAQGGSAAETPPDPPEEPI